MEELLLRVKYSLETEDNFSFKLVSFHLASVILSKLKSDRKMDEQLVQENVQFSKSQNNLVQCSSHFQFLGFVYQRLNRLDKNTVSQKE